MQYDIITMPDGRQKKVSRLILGTAQFGTGIPQELAFQMMDRYWEAGGRVLDTARVYGAWIPGMEAASERVVGAWVRSRGVAEEAFVITKGGHPDLRTMDVSRLQREDILFDAEQSLENLGLDAIDLYYLHRDERSRAAAEIMDSLQEAGQRVPIRLFGASNWRTDRIREANAYARQAGIREFSASEIRWSYVQEPAGFGDPTTVTMDADEYEAYKDLDLMVMAFSSQGGGLFQKGYAPDLSDLPDRKKAFATEENIRRYKALLDLCEKTGMTPSRFMIRYITDDPHLNAFAIVGCSSVEQLVQSLEAMEDTANV